MPRLDDSKLLVWADLMARILEEPAPSALLERQLPQDRELLFAVRPAPQGASDADAATAVRLLYSKLPDLPDAQRFVLVRALVRPP